MESTGFHTSLLFVLLGASVLCIRPRSGVLAAATSRHLGGLAARRILPVAIAAPLLFGWLCLAGERAGLYTTEFGIALFTTANIVLFTVIVRASARLLNRVDAKNGAAANVVQQSGLELKAAHEKLFASEERFRLFMEYFPASAFLKDREGRYIWGNSAWRRRFPEEWGDIYGKKDTELWPPEVHRFLAQAIKGCSAKRACSTGGDGQGRPGDSPLAGEQVPGARLRRHAADRRGFVRHNGSKGAGARNSTNRRNSKLWGFWPAA